MNPKRFALLSAVVLVCLAVYAHAADDCGLSAKKDSGPKCEGKPVKYEFAGSTPSFGMKVVFWAIIVYLFVQVFGGFYLEKRRDPSPNNPFYVDDSQSSIFLLRHHIPLWHSVVHIFSNAIMIIIAMLWSTVFENVFAVMYLQINGSGKEEKKECPERFGTYSCAYGTEEEDKSWSIILPTFFTTLILVMFTLYMVAAKFEKFWVDIFAGWMGHLVGFRWVDGVVKKLYGGLEFKDIYELFGVTGTGWVAFNKKDHTGAMPPRNLHIWNSSIDAFNPGNVIAGGNPTLQKMPASVVGMLSEADQEWAKNYYADSGLKQSAVAGIGGNPSIGQPWCFFEDTGNPSAAKFMCYVQSTIQEAHGYWWPKEGAYGHELFTRCWKMVAITALSFLLLFIVRGMHVNYLYSWMFPEDEAEHHKEKAKQWKEHSTALETHIEMVRRDPANAGEPPLSPDKQPEKKSAGPSQADIDMDEYADALNDVLADATANASGWVMAMVAYWCTVWLATAINGMYIPGLKASVQFGTTSPFLLLIMTVFFASLMCTAFTNMQVGSRHYHSSFGDFVEKYAGPPAEEPEEGEEPEEHITLLNQYTTTVMKFMIGYYILFLWTQVLFQAGRSGNELERVRCTNGFTAFTPNFPEQNALSDIFAPSVLSKFGTAILLTVIAVSSLAYDKMMAKDRMERKALMHDLHVVIKRIRQEDKLLKRFQYVDTELHHEQEERAKAHQAIIEEHEGIHDIKYESEEAQQEHEAELWELRMGDKRESLSKMIVHIAAQAHTDLKSHAKLLKKQVDENRYSAAWLDNKAEALGVAIGLALEGVIESTTDEISSCDFLHAAGSCALAQCKADSELKTACRVLLVNFIAASAMLSLVLLFHYVMTTYGFESMKEEEEEHPNLDDESSSDDDDEDEEEQRFAGWRNYQSIPTDQPAGGVAL